MLYIWTLRWAQWRPYIRAKGAFAPPPPVFLFVSFRRLKKGGGTVNVMFRERSKFGWNSLFASLIKHESLLIRKGFNHHFFLLVLWNRSINELTLRNIVNKIKAQVSANFKKDAWKSIFLPSLSYYLDFSGNLVGSWGKLVIFNFNFFYIYTWTIFVFCIFN